MAQLITCPECNKHLQVPEELLGKRVQCPECKHTFTAASEESGGFTAGSSSAAPSPPPPASAPPKPPAWETGKSSSRKRKNDDEESYDVEDRDDEDDEDPDERPRRRRRRRAPSRNYGAPHRGGMILAFGLIGILAMGAFPLGMIFGLMAWIMGNSDMAEIHSGRMDPEGEGMTQAGRIMGIISTILHLLGLIGCCGYFVCVFGFVGLNVANAPPPPRRRF